MIAELEAENIILDKKVQKLKIKKDNSEEAMQDMTNELCHMCATVFKHSRFGEVCCSCNCYAMTYIFHCCNGYQFVIVRYSL